MTIALLGSLAGALLGWLMGFLSLFLIMLILIQRGKGGGLTGALGGPGGQSAFGSKAGDTFTLITVVVASVWGFTCAFTMWLLGTHTPTTVTRTNISAGPGDDEADSTGNELIIPSGDGFGGLGSDDTSGITDSVIPSPDLTPATPSDETPADEIPAKETSESESPDSEDSSADAADAETADADDTTTTPDSEPETSPPETESGESASTDPDDGSETGDN